MKRGDVVKVKNTSFDMEIIGVMSAGQPFHVSFNNSPDAKDRETLYSVRINGKQIYLKQSIIDVLINSQKKSKSEAGE